ncbi:MAG TPA: lysozyme inhibitor LprI family protein [Burkholderiales bacterium]|jgi:uncharacterized protein YecT (DUF1311 family)|nr:lysozyme inhibitor LprI family protein [Burkholderiales bacterium]
MKILTPASLLLAALFAAGSAQAQLKVPPPAPGAPQSGVVQPNMPDPLTKEFHACVQKVQDAAQAAKAPPDPATATACFVAEIKRQEAKITSGTQRVDKGLNAAEKKRLDEANVAWRRFRDVECVFFADPKGSPIDNANNAQCMLDRTIKRALDMEGLALALSEKGAPPGAGAPPPPGAPPPAAPAKK